MLKASLKYLGIDNAITTAARIFRFPSSAIHAFEFAPVQEYHGAVEKPGHPVPPGQ